MPAKGKGLVDQFTCGSQNPSTFWKNVTIFSTISHLSFLGHHSHHHGC